MQFDNDFWNCFDQAMEDVSNDPEWQKMEKEKAELIERLGADKVDRVTKAIELQSLLIMQEIYRLSKFGVVPTPEAPSKDTYQIKDTDS